MYAWWCGTRAASYMCQHHQLMSDLETSSGAGASEILHKATEIYLNASRSATGIDPFAQEYAAMRSAFCMSGAHGENHAPCSASNHDPSHAAAVVTAARARSRTQHTPLSTHFRATLVRNRAGAGGRAHRFTVVSRGWSRLGNPPCPPPLLPISSGNLSILRSQHKCPSRLWMLRKCSSWQRQRGDPQFAMTHVLGTATTAEAQVVPSLPACEKGVAEEAHFRRVCSDLITEMGEHLGRTKGHRGLIFVFEG